MSENNYLSARDLARLAVAGYRAQKASQQAVLAEARVIAVKTWGNAYTRPPSGSWAALLWAAKHEQRVTPEGWLRRLLRGLCG